MESGLSELPNTFIVGASKCGTTSLAKYLNAHPKVHLPSIKEPRFMVRDVLNRVNPNDPTLPYLKKSSVVDEGAYKELYQGKGEPVRIDASVHYLYHFEVAIENILRYSGPESKIIIMLRDPVKRAISNWVYQKRDLFEFGRSLELEKQRMKQNFDSFWFYAEAGLYFNQVKAYKKAFKNIYICLFEEFIKRPDQELCKIYDFLGLQPLDLHSHETHNKSNKSQAIPTLTPFLNAFINRNQFVNGVFRTMDKKRLLPKQFYKTKNEAINQSDMDSLFEYYRSDIRHLEILLNKNLSFWNR